MHALAEYEILPKAVDVLPDWAWIMESLSRTLNRRQEPGWISYPVLFNCR